MNKKYGKVAVFLVIILMTTGLVFAQGNLTPSGAPSAGMKTLEQIESRTPISSAGFVITNSGSYYITGNLFSTNGQNGITVNANDVTIDLNGFTLSGSGTNSGYGIYQSSTLRNLTVSNGKVVNWRGTSKGGIYTSGESLDLSNVQSATNYYGIYAYSGGTINNCATYHNGTYGIYAYSGGTINNCLSYNNGSIGIYTLYGGTINNCASYNNGTQGIHASYGGTINNSSSYNNGNDGIYAYSGGTINNCASYNNGTYGIHAYSGGMINNCASYNNGSIGIYAYTGTTITGCSFKNNTGDGIKVNLDSLVVDNQCNNNGFLTGDGAGIHAVSSDNRIDRNNVTDNDRGIDVDVGGNFIVRNSASGNNTNYAITGTQTIGPIITATGTITNSNPWANFEF